MDNHNETPQLSAITLPETFEMIPAELRDLRQWVCWRFEQKAGEKKPRKVPIIAGSSTWAKVNAPDTWRDFDTAWGAAKASSGLLGIGFVFAADDPYFGIDLDHAITEAGELVPEAQQIIDRMASYGEVSPSGRGVKLIVKATKPARAQSRSDVLGPPLVVELYEQSRYFTITGKSLDADIALVPDRQLEVDELCARLWPNMLPAPAAAAGRVAPIVGGGPDLVTRCKKYLVTCPDAISGEGGQNETFHAACICFRFGLSDDQALEVMRWYNHTKTGGEQWTDAELLHKLEGARKAVEGSGEFNCMNDPSRRRNPRVQCGVIAQSASAMPNDDIVTALGVKLGDRDPESGKVVLDSKKTLPSARAFLREQHMQSGVITVRSQHGELFVWGKGQYHMIEPASLQQSLQQWLHRAVREQYNRNAKAYEFVPFDSNPHAVNQVLDTIKAEMHLDATRLPPCWLPGVTTPTDAHAWKLTDCLFSPSSIVHVPTGESVPATPACFNVGAVTFDHDPAAPQPLEWLKFLDQIFEADQASRELLQEWFGYCLVQKTNFQKSLLIIGPKRAGKGTIGRVLRQLIGEHNCCGPTVSGLAGHFGLQPLLYKSLAIVSDARFTGQNVHILIERLLNIIGEDAITIDRKHRTSVTMTLPTRFTFLTNDIPELPDASTALMERFLVIRLTESFAGREDVTLSDKLGNELPGILLWAMEGLRRLLARGRFVQPEGGLDTVRCMKIAASPVATFLSERCSRVPDSRVLFDDLHRAYKTWASQERLDGTLSPQEFGRELNSALPGKKLKRTTGGMSFLEGVQLLN
ncbi:MAG: phage/plasmid primase, P4 family [Phycisphaerae bacterium]